METPSRDFLVGTRRGGAFVNECIPSISYVGKGGVEVFTSVRLFSEVSPATRTSFCRYTWQGQGPVPLDALSALNKVAAFYENESDRDRAGAYMVFRELPGKVIGDGSPAHVSVGTRDVPAGSGGPNAVHKLRGGSMGCSSCVEVHGDTLRVILPEEAIGHEVHILPDEHSRIGRLVLTEGYQAFWLDVPAEWAASAVVVDW